MNREAPVLKFDYRLQNDYCKLIIDYGKNLIITPLVGPASADTDSIYSGPGLVQNQYQDLFQL